MSGLYCPLRHGMGEPPEIHGAAGDLLHRGEPMLLYSSSVALEARRLVELRGRWLTPPEWVQRSGSRLFEAADYP